MKLFKYRSLKNIEFVLDILLNNRLHCAPYAQLNDPFEGMFFSCYYPSHPLLTMVHGLGGKIKSPKSLGDLPMSIEKSKVCSLSASLSDVRLWSNYADGHQGIAIEIDFSGLEQDVKPVSYMDELPERGSTILDAICMSSESILSFKTKHWLHEKEYRIIQEEKFYRIRSNAITAVYTGVRAPIDGAELLRKIVPPQIPILSTVMNAQTLEIEVKNNNSDI